MKVAFVLHLGRVNKDTFLQEKGERRMPQKEVLYMPKEKKLGRIANKDKPSSRTE